MAQQGRVQVRDLQADISLRPAPMQSDTFAAPARPVENRNAARLADALSSFSGAFGSLVGIAGKTSHDEKERQDYETRRQFANRSPAEWNQAVVSGQIKNGQTTEIMAMNSMAGDGMADHQIEELRKKYAEQSDWDADDVEGETRQLMATTLEQYAKNNPSFGKPYMRRMEAYIGSLRTAQQQRGIQKYEEAKKDAAFSHISVTYKDADREGLTPEQKADRIFEQSKHLGKNGSLILDNKEVDNMVFAQAARIVDEDPETALAIINKVRKGADGRDIPAIASKRQLADQVEGLKARATIAIDKKSEATQKGDLVRQGAEAIRNGDFDMFSGDKTIVLPSGKQVKMEGATLKDAAISAYEQSSNKYAQDHKEDWKTTIARDEMAYGRSGLNNPVVEKALKGVASQTDTSVLQDDKALNQLSRKAELYEQIKNNSVNRLRGYTQQEDREFMEAFLLGRNTLGYDDAQAAAYAIKVNSVLDPSTLPKVDYKQDEISRGAAEVMNRSYGFDPDASNYSDVHSRITALARNNVSMGMNPDTAIENAVKLVKNSSVFFNGAVIPNVHGQGPDNFEGVAGDMIQGYLEKYAPKQLKDGALDPGNLILQPVNKGDNTRFMLVEKDDFTPVRGDDGKARYVSLEEMRRFERKKLSAERDKAKQEVIEQQRKSATEMSFEDQRRNDIREGKRPGFTQTLGGFDLPKLGGANR